MRVASSGLHLREDMSYDAWLTVGRRISGIERASAWCLGDWLVYGQRAYGERYKHALEATGFEYQTLRNYAWVARRFVMSRRRDALSFQHHAEVASLPEPEQDLWLLRAEKRRWSRNELRRQLTAAPRSGGQASPPVTVRLQVEQGRQERWQLAATASGASLPDWLGSLADAAAGGAPEPPSLAAPR